MECFVEGLGGERDWELFDSFNATKSGQSSGARADRDLSQYSKIKYVITGNITIYGSSNNAAANLSTKTGFVTVLTTGTSTASSVVVPISISTEGHLFTTVDGSLTVILHVSPYTNSSYYSYPSAYNAIKVADANNCPNYLQAVNLNVSVYVK